MSNWYNPSLPPSVNDQDLLNQWAVDCGANIPDLSVFSAEETARAIEALRTLAHWFSTPSVPDYSNPYWMEDEGFNDADAATGILQGLERKLRNSPGVTLPAEIEAMDSRKGAP